MINVCNYNIISTWHSNINTIGQCSNRVHYKERYQATKRREIIFSDLENFVGTWLLVLSAWGISVHTFSRGKIILKNSKICLVI